MVVLWTRPCRLSSLPAASRLKLTTPTRVLVALASSTRLKLLLPSLPGNASLRATRRTWPLTRLQRSGTTLHRHGIYRYCMPAPWHAIPPGRRWLCNLLFRSPPRLHHRVAIVCCGTALRAARSTLYCIIKNSWGSGCSERRFDRVVRRHGECRLATSLFCSLHRLSSCAVTRRLFRSWLLNHICKLR